MGTESLERGARRLLVLMNVGLALLFAAMFTLLLSRPAAVEGRAREELRRRVQAALVEKYPELGAASRFAGIVSTLKREIAEGRAKKESPELDVVAAIVANVCRHCGNQADLAAGFRRRIDERLRHLGLALARVEDWAQERYRRLFDELVRDLSIFTGTNALLCFLGALAARSPYGNWRIKLAVPAIMLLAMACGVWAYAFAQDWLQTLLFASYYGYAYAVLVGLVAGALLDMLFNEGRVVQALLHAFATVIESLTH